MNGEERTADRDDAGEALQVALAGYLGAQQLSLQSLAYLYGSSVPTTVLWLSSWHRVPDLVAWFAALGWCLCAFMAVALATIAAKRRSQADAAVPGANRAARMHFSFRTALPDTSVLLFGLAAATSSLLCVHGLAPHSLGADTVVTAGRAWIVLVAGAVLNRFLERT
jgi:hypothetical protein